jgi:hypothetical protein
MGKFSYSIGHLSFYLKDKKGFLSRMSYDFQDRFGVNNQTHRTGFLTPKQVETKTWAQQKDKILH